ncbi:uncharacterized protein [Euphorbia lathyris]|uniref:uncharacterized protein isoform X2 n=1 Tax=Euphorbia lathyris TaxID=212925 RepID=UPI0033140B4A
MRSNSSLPNPSAPSFPFSYASIFLTSSMVYSSLPPLVSLVALTIEAKQLLELELNHMGKVLSAPRTGTGKFYERVSQPMCQLKW